MSFEIVPTGAALGAEIRGANLAGPLNDATFTAIERAYNQYGVIFFRDQHITPPQQVANVTEGGQPIGVRRAGENWHSDMCYAPRPPRGTMLYALEIPDLFGLSLGDTEFASAAAAWDALPEQLRQRVEGRRAVFDFSGRKRAFPPKQSEIDRYPPLTHPIVRTHPYTLRKCLYVMRDDCTTIEGIDPEEAAALIAALAEHIVKPAFIYRHQWRRGDLLMWDNCTVQHRAIQDYDLPHRRLMHRTTMGGAVPV